jgi:hypothetical protein
MREVMPMPGEMRGPVLVVNAFFIIVPIFFIVSGICSLFWPRMMWFLAEGWKFKDAQPSGCYLVATRVGGLLILTVGIVWFVILWSLVHAR